jgi:NADPH-dependent ferric siderophore reductase
MAPDHIDTALLPRRVRFETRRRQLTVTDIVDLTAHMRRITLHGDLEGFQSLGFDDHLKLFLPDPETGILTLPGEEVDGGPRPIARDYTPRLFDVTAGILVLDFALHGIGGDAGPATRWAANARRGDRLHLGGPRGSSIPPAQISTCLLLGDDTALPAIGRRLAELPATARALVLAEVESPSDRIEFETKANASIHWVFRHPAHGGRTLLDAVHGLCLPEGPVLAWVACEAGQARLIREKLSSHQGLDPQLLKAAGYWQKEEAGGGNAKEP